MKLWANSLRARLVGYFGILSLVMTSSVGAIAFIQAKIYIENNIYQDLTNQINLKEKALQNWIDTQIDNISSFAKLSGITNNVQLLLNNSPSSPVYQQGKRELTKYINSVLIGQPEIQEVFIINLEGKVIFANTAKKEGEKLIDQPYFIKGQTKTYLENLYFSPSEKNRKITIATPLRNQQGKLISVLGIEFNFLAIDRLIFEDRKLNNNTKAYLIDRFGFLLYTEYPQINNQNQILEDNVINLLKSGKSGQQIYKNYQNNKVIGVYHWLDKLQLGLLMETPEKEALLPARKLAWYIVIIGAGVSSLSILIFYLLAQQITRPILAIKNTAIKVREGNLKAFAPILSEDEVGILARVFNEMLEEFNYLYNDFQEQVTQLELAEISAVYTYSELEKEKKKVEDISNQLTNANEEINLLNKKLKSENIGLATELKITNKRLIEFLNAIPVGVVVFDYGGNVYYANYQAKNLLGNKLKFKDNLYLKDSLQGELASYTMGTQSLKLGIPTHLDNLEVHQEKKIIPLESWETPIFNSAGRVEYAIIAFQDITERRKNEEERQKFTQKILTLNQANERFVPREFLQLLNKKSITEVELGDNIEREMSVLFSDIRDFTKLSENMTPTDNFRFINAFLSRLTPSIDKYNGFIDKYIGDSIMALFGGNADDAVRAAISMLERLKKYNTTRQRPGRRPINIGIGINTGLMMLGTVGSRHRMDGTVISDSVNLAARLETLTKIYNVSLLISHYTFLRLQDSSKYCIRLVDRVTVKGKSIPVAVYEVFDADEKEVKEHKLATKTLFEQGISLYHLGKSKQAIMNFRQCLMINPDDKLSQVYLERCSTLC
jgi:PAS domain S-box-containing protein